VTSGQDPVRRAVEDDLFAISELVRAAYGKYLVRMDIPPAPMMHDLRPQVRSEQVWVSGRPISAVICLVAQRDGLLVENVAVHPDEQGTGRGRNLMDFAETDARRLGLDRLRLYTNELMTENIAFYEHLGFHELDRRTDEGYRRVFMEKLLV
jgi:N-acetylglutamate synthase-like GNAT family acetyltransferase